MENNEMSSKFFLPAAVVLAGLFIAGAVVWNGSHPAAGTAGRADSRNSSIGKH
jgi:hypothetical protein